MDFAAFVLLNTVLYIRPMEFVPALYGLPLYNIGFCACLALSLPRLLNGGAVRSIVVHPIGACVLTVAVTAVLSGLFAGGMQAAVDAADVFLKIILYYILLIVVVRSPARMRWFLASLVVDATIIAGLGVADYQGIYHVPNLSMIEDAHYLDGEVVPFRRLASTGLFGDPNDLCVFLAGSVINCLYLASDRSVAMPIRALWLPPVMVIFLAIRLTYSRGGMLALLAGLAIYGACRYGRRGLIAIAIAMPIILGVGGRQLDFDASSGTGQSRIELWDFYLDLFIHNPLLGIGFNRSTDYTSHVAHNSYIHAYAELGILGGTAFLAMMLLGAWAVWRVRVVRTGGIDPELARLWPFMLAGLGSYVIGISSLSRCFVIPTYTIVGLAAAYEGIALAGSSRRSLQIGLRMIGLLLLASFACIVVMFLFVKKNANY